MIRRVLFLMFVSILTAGGPLSQPTAAAQAQTADTTTLAKQHYKNAVAAITKSDWQMAKSELIQAAKLAPQNALIHYDLALAYSHTGQAKSAELEVNKALKLGLPREQKRAAEQLKDQMENPPTPVLAETKSPPIDGPSLDETLSFLQRMISEGGKATFSSKGGYSDYRESWQEAVVVGSPTSCIVSWDEVKYTHYMDGTPPTARGITSVKHSSREFLSLKDLMISNTKVLDLKSWAFSKDGPIMEQHDHGDYSGFVLATDETSNKVLIKGDSIPNPSHSEVSPYIDHTGLGVFFASQSDAERSLKALVHAATICGAKADPF